MSFFRGIEKERMFFSSATSRALSALGSDAFSTLLSLSLSLSLERTRAQSTLAVTAPTV